MRFDDIVEEAGAIPIHAELHRDDIAIAEGIKVRAYSPVIALCRKLLDAGFDPSTPLEAYRAGALSIRVSSIGIAAQLAVEDDASGHPRFRKARSRSSGAASHIAFSGEAGTEAGSTPETAPGRIAEVAP